MATKKVNIDIIAKDKSKQALKGVRSNLDSVKKSVFNLRNAFVGLGAGLVIKSLINTGKEIEGLQVRLKFLFGTAEEGAKAFDEMAKFASKVPFSLQEIQKGAGVLAVVSKDAEELAHIMKITGNVAAVTGLDFKTTAEQIQRSLSAGISAADLFRDRGVKAMLGFKAGAKVSIEETVEAFERVFGAGGKFDGATDALAQTFEGTLSMIGDKIFNFKRTILEAGFFPELKKQFGDLNKFLEENKKTLDEIAITIGKGLAEAVVKTGEAMKFVAKHSDAFLIAAKGLIALKLAKWIYAAATASFVLGKRLMFAQSMAGPKGWASIGVGLAAMGTSLALVNTLLGETSDGMDNAFRRKEIKDTIKLKSDQIKELEKNLKSITKEIDENTTKSLKELHQGFADENNQIIGQNLINASNQAFDEQINKLKGEIANLNKELNDIPWEPIPFRSFHKDFETLNVKAEEIANTYDFLSTSIGDTRSEWQKASVSMGLNTEMLSHNNKEIVKHISATEIMAKSMEQVPPILQETFTKWNSIRDIMKDVVVETENVQTRFGSFKEGFANAMDTDIFEKFEEIGGKTFNSLTKMLTDFVTTGKMNFEDFARTVTRMITEALIGQAVQWAMGKAVELWKNSALRDAMISVYTAALRAFKNFGGWPFGVMAAGATIGFGMNLVKKIGAFEKGGRPPVNQPSIVGEAGPELFVPNSAGSIIPNNQLGGGSTTVNFNINTVDARGFNELLVNSRGVIVNMINSAVNEKGRAAII